MGKVHNVVCFTALLPEGDRQEYYEWYDPDT
jgi:hypothetical protein